MDFNPSDEQRMLADSVSRFVRNRYDLERRNAYLARPSSYCTENWQMLAELGITALVLPAERGGFDGTPADVAAVMEQLGKGLVVEPVISSAVIAARVLAAASTHAEIAAAAGAGKRRIAIAFADPPASRPGPAQPMRYEVAGGGLRLKGIKTLAVQALGADAVIFPCTGPQGFAAFLISPDTLPGITRKDYRLLDGSLASEFHFDDIEIAGGDRLVDVTLEDWITAKIWGGIAVCAEMLGIMGRLLDETGHYLRTRKQFGGAIGKFQALQHQMARMLMEQEKARALLYRAVTSFPEAGHRGAVRDCHRFMGKAAMDIGEGCLHLHGGIGVTDELFVGKALKRINFLRYHVSLDELRHEAHRCC